MSEDKMCPHLVLSVMQEHRAKCCFVSCALAGVAERIVRKNYWAASYFVGCIFVIVLLRSSKKLYVLPHGTIREVMLGLQIFALGFLLCDMVSLLIEFPFLDPDSFHTSYSNGTAYGPEWHTELCFPTWLWFLVLFSVLPVTAVVVLSTYILYTRVLFLQHQEDEPPDVLNPEVEAANPITSWIIRQCGQHLNDLIFMVLLMPSIVALLCFANILRMMQLVTGRYNEDQPQHESDDLCEKIRYILYLVAGNTDCIAFFIACSLLSFGAYLLRRIEPVMGQQEQKMMQEWVMQTLKYYVCIAFLQMFLGIMSSVVFMEEHSMHRSNNWILILICNLFDQHAPFVFQYLKACGTMASMCCWGGLSVLSKFCDARELQPGMLEIMFAKCKSKFLSVKLMVSVSFVQQSAVFVLGQILRYPTLTTILAGECLKCIFAFFLAHLMWRAWEDAVGNAERPQPQPQPQP